MLRPIQYLRLLQINIVLARYTLNRSVLGSQSLWLRALSYLNPLSFLPQGKTRGESIRLALESLGPIFVKFGQLLSTRDNLLPEDIIYELTKLQDSVAPFPPTQAVEIIERSFGKKITELFARFDTRPLASASVAQVHAAQLFDGSEVIVKIVRPKIDRMIRHDIAIMYSVARLTERFWAHGKRLRLVELVSEFEQTILDELDLAREAANASQLRRNFQDSKIMYVPKIYWDLVHSDVMVMERIYGVQISDIATLKQRNTNMRRLSENGVEIFFTQVFRDSFFHADMHPGNLFVDVSDPENPRYLGVDFGIMGSLNPSDQQYLAANLLAFFHRDYRQIAVLHVESGWVPPDTRIDQFEGAIRTVCEPIFEKPLREISFGNLLLRLFQTAERFNMTLQPQLMLLQKTLLNIESLGRQLYPDLDLWTTAKPFLEKWMGEQRGLLHLAEQTLQDFPHATEKVLKSPQVLYDVLHEIERLQRVRRYAPQNTEKSMTKVRHRAVMFGAGLALTLVTAVNWYYLPEHDWQQFLPWQWATAGVALLLLFVGWRKENSA